jgi:hypothetical protein
LAIFGLAEAHYLIYHAVRLAIKFPAEAIALHQSSSFARFERLIGRADSAEEAVPHKGGSKESLSSRSSEPCCLPNSPTYIIQPHLRQDVWRAYGSSRQGTVRTLSCGFIENCPEVIG